MGIVFICDRCGKKIDKDIDTFLVKLYNYWSETAGIVNDVGKKKRLCKKCNKELNNWFK